MPWRTSLFVLMVVSIYDVPMVQACQKCCRQKCVCVRTTPVCCPGTPSRSAGATSAAKPASSLADDLHVGGNSASERRGTNSIADDINLNISSNPGQGTSHTTLPAWAEENWKELVKLNERRATSSEILDLSRERVLKGDDLSKPVKDDDRSLRTKIAASWGLK